MPAGLDLDLARRGGRAAWRPVQRRRPAQRDLGAVLAGAQADVRLRRQVGGVGQARPRIGAAADVEPLAVLGGDVHDARDHDHAQLADAARALGGTAAFERQHLEADVVESGRLGRRTTGSRRRARGPRRRRSGAHSCA